MTQKLSTCWSAAGVAYCCALIAGALDLDLVLRLTLQLLALGFAWRACTFHGGFLQAIGVYLPVSGLYVLAPMLEVSLFGNRLDLDADRMAMLADIGIGFLGCVAIGASVVPQQVAVEVRRPIFNESTASAAVNTCIALLIISVTMTVQRYGVAVGNISRADLYVEEYAMLSLVRGVLALSLGITAAIILAAERVTGQRISGLRARLLVTLAIYTLVDLLILGDRRLPLLAVLAVAILLSPGRISWRAVISAAAFILVLALYGMVRNTPPSEWASILAGGEVLGALSPAANEFGGLAIIGGAIDDIWRTPQGFPTYEQAFLQILPKALIANRPQSPTEWFVWSYFPALAEIGASFAFNAVIEALANGGVLCVPLAGGLTGLSIGMLSNLRWAGAPVGVALATYIFTFSMRMDLASILRTALVATMGLLLLLTVSALLERCSRSNRRPINQQRVREI